MTIWAEPNKHLSVSPPCSLPSNEIHPFLCPPSPYSQFAPTISTLFIHFNSISPSVFPLLPSPLSLIPPGLPDGVLFCRCDPLMPSNRAGNILKGFGQGWFGSFKYCSGDLHHSEILTQSWSLEPSHKTGILVPPARHGFKPGSLWLDPYGHSQSVEVHHL